MTFVIRGSGFVSRKLVQVVGRGKPVLADLEPYLQRLVTYRDQIMYLAWNLKRAEPKHAQLEVRRIQNPGPDPDYLIYR